MAEPTLSDRFLMDYDIDSSSKSSSPERPVRGRGRGRGRGSRSRSSSRRGRSGLARSESREENAGKTIEERLNSVRDEINGMDVDECRKTLLKVVEKCPSLIVEVMRPSTRQPGGYHPDSNVGAPNWCICLHCREMPTEEEKVCCRKQRCLSTLPDFQTIMLDEGVLTLARKLRREILIYDDEISEVAAFRHAAYRQFILWMYGHLGAGDRRVIPSCCVWRIRDKYPDPFGQYVGFKSSRV